MQNFQTHSSNELWEQTMCACQIPCLSGSKPPLTSFTRSRDQDSRDSDSLLSFTQCFSEVTWPIFSWDIRPVARSELPNGVREPKFQQFQRYLQELKQKSKICIKNLETQFFLENLSKLMKYILRRFQEMIHKDY